MQAIDIETAEAEREIMQLIERATNNGVCPQRQQGIRKGLRRRPAKPDAPTPVPLSNQPYTPFCDAIAVYEVDDRNIATPRPPFNSPILRK